MTSKAIIIIIIIIIIRSFFEDKYDQQSHMTITYSICNTVN